MGLLAVVLFLTLRSLAPWESAMPADRDDRTDWPRWRGPHGNGRTDARDWDPKRLDGEPTVLWRARVGQGMSAPTVVGGLLYTIGNERGRHHRPIRRARMQGEQAGIADVVEIMPGLIHPRPALAIA